MSRSNAPGSQRWTATARSPPSRRSGSPANSPPVQLFFMLLTTRVKEVSFGKFHSPLLSSGKPHEHRPYAYTRPAHGFSAERGHGAARLHLGTAGHREIFAGTGVRE